MTAAGLDLDLTTWLTAIMLPVLGALFWMIQGVKRDLQARLDVIAQRKLDALLELRDDLASHKLDVARGYAPMHAIRDIDRRISLQLMRIEDRLDRLGARPARLSADGPEIDA
jgi:hypothetical protein